MATESSKPNRTALLVRVIVTLIFFAMIFWLLPMGEVWKAMTSLGWWRWLLVAGIFGMGHVVSAYKWCQLVRVTGSPLLFNEALRAHFAGLFANIWLPSIVGGDVVRAAWISGRHGVTVPAVIGLLDRLLDLLALLSLVACGTLLLWVSGAEVAGFMIGGAALLLIIGVASGLIALIWLRSGALPPKIRPVAAKINAIVQSLYARPGPALKSFCLAFIVQFVFVGLNWYLGVGLGIAVSFAVWLFVWPLAKIMALLPVSLGGLGVREAALAALLAPFAVSGTLAVAQGLVWQSVLFGVGILAGVITLLGSREKGRSGLS